MSPNLSESIVNRYDANEAFYVVKYSYLKINNYPTSLIFANSVTYLHINMYTHETHSIVIIYNDTVVMIIIIIDNMLSQT